MQVYSDPDRENDEHALPDVEVFYISEAVDHDVVHPDSAFIDDDGDYTGDGWYWWYCFPSCLPDSDPIGPFDTEEEATKEAQEE